MILIATQGQTAAPPVIAIAVEHASASRVFQATAEAGLPLEFSLQEFDGGAAELAPQTPPAAREFDWNQPKIVRDYNRLEQQVLAGKAGPAEQDLYRAMKRDRHAVVFAERYVQDYAEIQRLRKLSEKLAEIQQYLRPIAVP